MREALGAGTWKGIEKHRTNHAAQYPTSSVKVECDVLDYTYLGHLGTLMRWTKAWDLFRHLFKDERQLEDLVDAIMPVRNDRAHFRSVPILELRRCQVACEDLRTRLGKDTSV